MFQRAMMCLRTVKRWGNFRGGRVIVSRMDGRGLGVVALAASSCPSIGRMESSPQVQSAAPCSDAGHRQAECTGHGLRRRNPTGCALTGMCLWKGRAPMGTRGMSAAAGVRDAATRATSSFTNVIAENYAINGGKGQAYTRRNLWYNIRRCLDWNEVFMWKTRVRCEDETVKLAATAAEWAGSRWMKGRRNGFRRADCWRSAVCGCAGRGLCRGGRRFRRESRGRDAGERPEIWDSDGGRAASVRLFLPWGWGKRQPDSKVETGCLRLRVRLTLTPRQADSDPKSG